MCRFERWDERIQDEAGGGSQTWQAGNVSLEMSKPITIIKRHRCISVQSAKETLMWKCERWDRELGFKGGGVLTYIPGRNVFARISKLSNTVAPDALRNTRLPFSRKMASVTPNTAVSDVQTCDPSPSTSVMFPPFKMLKDASGFTGVSRLRSHTGVIGTPEYHTPKYKLLEFAGMAWKPIVNVPFCDSHVSSPLSFEPRLITPLCDSTHGTNVAPRICTSSSIHHHVRRHDDVDDSMALTSIIFFLEVTFSSDANPSLGRTTRCTQTASISIFLAVGACRMPDKLHLKLTLVISSVAVCRMSTWFARVVVSLLRIFHNPGPMLQADTVRWILTQGLWWPCCLNLRRDWSKRQLEHTEHSGSFPQILVELDDHTENCRGLHWHCLLDR